MLKRTMKTIGSCLGAALLAAAAGTAVADEEIAEVDVQVISPAVGFAPNTMMILVKNPSPTGIGRCMGGGVFAALPLNQEGFKAIYAMVLAANTAGKEVKISYTYQSNGQCQLLTVTTT